ncbi:MAG: SAM-dependent methyltransferase, partial [Chitinophagaceae bacterium]|nr:SAM-dependent methyltransferase [Chitinophagaceae bacterium]
PAVADPGKELIALAHQLKIKIKPHVGPNSILLTLMASGFNGQQFSFHGYLPNKQPQLNQKISALEKQSQLNNETILFIETPYRNEQLKTTLLQNCHPETQLCIAANLTSNEEIIITKKIKEWKNETLNFHKIPAVFAIYAGN